jgi:hypothetical protein
MFGDVATLEAGVREAVLSEVRRQPELESELATEQAEDAVLRKEHEDLYKKIKLLDLHDGSAMLVVLRADIKRIEAQREAKKDRIQALERRLKVTRLPPDLTERLDFMLFCLRGPGRMTWLWDWPPAEKRRLCPFLFGDQTRKPPEGSAGEASRRGGIYLRRAIDEKTGKDLIVWTAYGWFPQISDRVWLDDKLGSRFRLSTSGYIDPKQAARLISALDLSAFKGQRSLFNARKPEGTRWSA